MTNQTAVAPRPQTNTVTDKGTLEGLMNNGDFITSLKTVLPKHLTPERVVKMALVAASRQPLLFKCTKQSFLQSLMKSAELGLDCSGTLGRAYLVPYWNSKISGYECQFIPGYQGLIELARRSGNIARIESRVVYAQDRFEVEYGLDQKLVHVPAMGAQRGEIQCVYAVAELTDGSRQIEIMTVDEINGIMARSKSKDKQGNNTGPWKTDYSEMARKTVIRRIAKYLPLSTELAKAFEADDEQFASDHFASGFAGELGANAAAGISGMKERLHLVDGEQPDQAPSTDDIVNQEIETAEDQVEEQLQCEADAASESVELTAKHQAEQIVFDLQKNYGVKAAELNGLLPDGVKKYSELSEEQAAEVLPSVRQILESKQAG